VQDHVGDVVAIVEGARAFPPRPARLVWSGVYDAFGEIAWQQWPVLETRPPPLAVGARGLFVERLDAPPVMWSVTEGGYVGDERLAPGGDHLILARNRAYQPRWGRFLQPDPNGTGVAVQPGLGWGGDLAGGALDVPPPHASLDGPGGWTRDGVNVHAYCAGDPINRSDPTGLFFGGVAELGVAGFDSWSTANDNFEMAMLGLRAGFGIAQQTLLYGAFQSHDVDWAMDWSQDDHANTHSVAFMYGMGPWREDEPGAASGTNLGPAGPAMAASNLEGVRRSTYTTRRSAWTSVRREIWKSMASSDLAKMNWSKADRDRMVQGLAPKGYVIHHIRPLSQGGTNSYSNLVIMRRSDHLDHFEALHRGGRRGLPRIPGLETDRPGGPTLPRRWR
jgi:hypothetical protein